MAYLWKHPKSKYWYAGWKDENGKRINRSTKIEAKPALRRDALKVAYEYEETTRKHRSAKQVRKAISELQKDILGDEMATATVREYVNRFLDLKRGDTKPKGLGYYKTALERFLEWLGKRADRDLALIDSASITRYRNDLLDQYATSTTNNQIKAIKAMITRAVSEGMISDNIGDSIKPTKKQGGASERRAFTMEELRALLKTATNEWRSMIIFGLYTGQRLGDLASLKWTAIDLQNNEIRLLTRKTAQPILLPIAEPLRDHILTLEAGEETDAYVHPILGNRYASQGSGNLSNQFVGILASCGLREPISHKGTGKGRSGRRVGPSLSFHSLRATAVTLMHEAGVPASMVEQWVGHNSKEVNRRYVKHGREALAQATSKLPNIL